MAAEGDNEISFGVDDFIFSSGIDIYANDTAPWLYGANPSSTEEKCVLAE